MNRSHVMRVLEHQERENQRFLTLTHFGAPRGEQHEVSGHEVALRLERTRREQVHPHLSFGHLSRTTEDCFLAVALELSAEGWS